MNELCKNLLYFQKGRDDAHLGLPVSAWSCENVEKACTIVESCTVNAFLTAIMNIHYYLELMEHLHATMQPVRNEEF